MTIDELLSNLQRDRAGPSDLTSIRFVALGVSIWQKTFPPDTLWISALVSKRDLECGINAACSSKSRHARTPVRNMIWPRCVMVRIWSDRYGSRPRLQPCFPAPGGDLRCHHLSALEFIRAKSRAWGCPVTMTSRLRAGAASRNCRVDAESWERCRRASQMGLVFRICFEGASALWDLDKDLVGL